MSMISAQIDELRELAGDGSMEWVAGPIRASVLRDAADTIWQLRDDLQRTNAENAKLRDERSEYQATIDSLVDECAEHKAENAKLRKLAAGIGYLLFALDVDYCVACPRDSINHPCPVYTVKGGECLYKTDLRELGVEVDG